ncbi:MAG: PAS domain-containing sensor histidine kinase [Geobacter sp.]|nr:MAG: PAS domain-containing sensor histidine kinase [Geobacter sp.]
MRLRLNIRNKLLFSILLVLLVSYAILAITTFKSVNYALEAQVSRNLEENLHYAQSQLFARADLITYSLSQPTSAPPVLENIRMHNLPWLAGALQRWRKVIPFVEVLTLVDPQKRVLARVGSGKSDRLAGLGYMMEQAFRTRKTVVSTELVSREFLEQEGGIAITPNMLMENEAMVMVVAMPVFAADGTLIGGVLAGDIINNDPNLPFQVQEVFGKEVEVTITQRGHRIASSIAEEIASPVSIDTEIMKRLERRLTYRGEAKIGNKYYETVIAPIANQGGEVIGSLSVALSSDYFTRIKRDNMRNIMASGAIGVLLSFGLAYLLARRVSKPLTDLTRGVEQIEAGELGQRVVVTSRDEFGMLADSFNRMASTLYERERTITGKTRDLQRLNEDLEQRVGERTMALRIEMGMLEAILTSMAEGIVVTDRENRVTLFNPSAQKIFGLTPNRVMHQPIEQACDMGGFCMLLEHIDAVRAGEGPTPREEVLRVAGRKIKVSLSPLMDEAGGFAGVVMSIRDVTVEEEVDRMKTEFISTVSHELKTPLTSMKGSLQFILAKGKWLTQTERELLSVCQRNTDRLIRLINDILDISTIESGRMQFAFGQVSIGELVVYACEEIKGFAQGRNISIVSDVATDLPPVCADHDRLIQVFTNLLSNAVKFSPSGKTVLVSAIRTGNYVTVSVADMGKAIQWSDREKLFKKFQQLGSSDPRERSGTGLGLAICKEIVEQHHGRIFYESGAAGGNVFTFTIPVYEETLNER